LPQIKVFLPGTKTNGGLSQHGRCLIIQYGGASCWDFDDVLKSKENVFTKNFRRFTNRFIDQNYLKFDCIDICSTIFFKLGPWNYSSILSFSGCALGLFENAKKQGIKFLELESPTAHVMHCHEWYEKAGSLHPIEKSWLTKKLRDKMLAEYQIADKIWVNSDYSFQTFLERGIPKSKLARRYLSIDSRFQRPTNKNKSNAFNLVYVGSLTVVKGVPLLLEAYQELSLHNSSLILVGGTGSSGMKKLLKRYNSYGNVVVCPGDPYPQLLDADLFVYPSWSDGYGYAPREAMGMGVPVIVSENTGMKEEIKNKNQGAIFKIGDKNGLKALILKYFHNRSWKTASSVV
jgi:glycosyltransferase involved in cell wall biosynthesis